MQLMLNAVGKILSVYTALILLCVPVFSSVSYAAFSSPEEINTKLLTLSHNFDLPHISGVRYDTADPLSINFIISRGDAAALDNEISAGLIRYFLAALTIPEDKLWVNLSPYEENRIIDDSVILTEIGQVLMEQDYILKCLASSLTHPDTELGKKYWNTANRQDNASDQSEKVWIVPETVQLYDNNGVLYIKHALFDVKTDADYNAMMRSGTRRVSSGAMREVIVPEIKKDVNAGENFARLRQMLYSIIVAQWFKRKFTGTLLSFYYDTEKIRGLDNADPRVKQMVFQQYVDSFNSGVYDLKRRENFNGRLVKRKYFSGGVIASSALAETVYVTMADAGNSDVANVFYNLEATVDSTGTVAMPSLASVAEELAEQTIQEQNKSEFCALRENLDIAMELNVDQFAYEDFILLGIEVLTRDTAAAIRLADGLKYEMKNGKGPQYDDRFDKRGNWVAALSLPQRKALYEMDIVYSRAPADADRLMVDTIKYSLKERYDFAIRVKKDFEAVLNGDKEWTLELDFDIPVAVVRYGLELSKEEEKRYFTEFHGTSTQRAFDASLMTPGDREKFLGLLNSERGLFSNAFETLDYDEKIKYFSILQDLPGSPLSGEDIASMSIEEQNTFMKKYLTLVKQTYVSDEYMTMVLRDRTREIQDKRNIFAADNLSGIPELYTVDELVAAVLNAVELGGDPVDIISYVLSNEVLINESAYNELIGWIYAALHAPLISAVEITGIDELKKNEAVDILIALYTQAGNGRMHLKDPAYYPFYAGKQANFSDIRDELFNDAIDVLRVLNSQELWRTVVNAPGVLPVSDPEESVKNTAFLKRITAEHAAVVEQMSLDNGAAVRNTLKVIFDGIASSSNISDEVMLSAPEMLPLTVEEINQLAISSNIDGSDPFKAIQAMSGSDAHNEDINKESELGGIDLTDVLKDIAVEENSSSIILPESYTSRINGLVFRISGGARMLPLRQLLQPIDGNTNYVK